MYCPKCGSEIAENAKFCVGCGSPVEAQPAQATYIGDGGLIQPALPMKWFKFVIYFTLWAGAILNFMSGIMALTGMQYETEYEDVADLVYAMFDGLKTADMVYGFLMIALAVFMIYTRFRLAGFYKNGPSLFVSTYVVALVINISYFFAVMAICGSELGDTTSVTSNLYISTLTSIFMIVVNIIYFKKRKHLFVK